jgi:hypothetical protein
MHATRAEAACRGVAREGPSEGTTVAELTAELGLASGTVLRWSSEAGSPMMVPVRIIDEHRARRTVSVVSPSGFRVDSLTLSEAAELLRGAGMILGSSRAVRVYAYPARPIRARATTSCTDS